MLVSETHRCAGFALSSKNLRPAGIVSPVPGPANLLSAPREDFLL